MNPPADESVGGSPEEVGEPRILPREVGPDASVEELLQENSRLRKRLQEIETLVNAHSVVAVTDRAGVITEVNRRFLEVSKYSREELIGKNHRIVKSGRHSPEFFQEMWETISRGKIWQGELCNVAKDGEEHWFATTIVPLLDERGEPERYVAIRNDITRLHQAERELWKLAYFDSRTHLPSRPSVLGALEDCTKRSSEQWCAFISLSLDDLAPVNDAFGYAKGDALLLYAAGCLGRLGKPVRLVGHVDTGVFGLLLGPLGARSEDAESVATEVAERALDAICGPAVLGVGVEIEATATAGIRLFRAGQLHAAHGPRQAHVPEVYVTGAISLVNAAFARFLHEEMPGDAAFYGPKIDIQAVNVFGKEDSVSTMQLDFNLPEKFQITYIDSEGKEKQPYVIHRALIGSFERFFSFLIEHHGGDFPLWFTPEQVCIIPISEKQNEYASGVFKKLKDARLRVKLDIRNKSMQARIRDAEKMKIPYIIVVGDKEIDTETISVRARSNKEEGLMKVQEFIDNLREESRTKETFTNNIKINTYYFINVPREEERLRSKKK